MLETPIWRVGRRRLVSEGAGLKRRGGGSYGVGSSASSHESPRFASQLTFTSFTCTIIFPLLRIVSGGGMPHWWIECWNPDLSIRLLPPLLWRHSPQRIERDGTAPKLSPVQLLSKERLGVWRQA